MTISMQLVVDVENNTSCGGTLGRCVGGDGCFTLVRSLRLFAHLLVATLFALKSHWLYSKATASLFLLNGSSYARTKDLTIPSPSPAEKYVTF